MGVFSSAETAAKALEALDKAGMKPVSFYAPFDPEEGGFPSSNKKSSVGRFTLVGAVFGVVLGLIFSVGTAIVYPVETGGLPILSLPAIGIISFDLMLLCAIIATIIGFVYCALLSTRRSAFVPACVSSDHFGISVQGDQKYLKRAGEVLKVCGAKKVGKQMASLWLGLSIVFLIPGLVLAWPWSQDMVNQATRKPQEDPIEVISSIVPRQGRLIEVTEKDEAAWIENPVSLSAASLERGKKLFETFCVVCHGKEGKGDGIIAERIGEFPDFTKKEFREQADGCIYFVITNGANFLEEVNRPRGGGSDEIQGSHDHEDGGEGEHEHEDEEAHHEDDESGHEHEKEELELDDPMFAADDHEHTHEQADPMLADAGHEEDHEHGHEDEHSHAHESEAGDDGHDHDHGDSPQCGSGHSHGEGDGHGDGGGHEHGSGKKHFMPPHRDAIRPIGRWHIVNYIKYELGQ